MKLAVSMFEKLLVSLIIFVFCMIVLIQILVNNNVLDTIKANEDGTPVSFEQSSAYTAKGYVKFSDIPVNKASLLLNGEEVNIAGNEDNQSFELEVFEGDVLEIKNNSEDIVTIYLLSTSEDLSTPSKGSKFECKKGITYLFKVEVQKIS